MIKILRKFGSLGQQNDVPCRHKEKLRILEFHVIYKETTQETHKGLTGCGNILFVFTYNELKVTRVTWVSQKNGNERCRPTQISCNLLELRYAWRQKKMMVLGP